MKGIVLAGGTGSRLFPLTNAFSKQLLPVYDKPLIHYPISTLFAAGIKDIAIITTPRDLELFKTLLGDGKDYGARFDYFIQPVPAGIPEAFLITEKFIGKSSVALILGDNIFFGSGLGRQLQVYKDVVGVNIFGYEVKNPQDYGVATVDLNGKVQSIEEKPINPKSNLAVTGLYFYDDSVVERTKNLKPSQRGELEVTDLNLSFLADNKLKLTRLPRGTSWLDTGTFQGLHDAASFVRVLEERQGTKIACLEEISWRNGWITDSELLKLASDRSRINNAEYLLSLLGDA
jgi:glucose-1-phosphate thymidylyltransferase